MIDGDILRLIREEVRKQVNIILSGQSGQNTNISEDIQNLYPGCPTIPDRPVMHPYGFVSRAPNGTIQVSARQGEHPGNRLILGHRDSARPDIGAGETTIYNQYGQQIYLKQGEIHIGKPASSDPVPLGNELIDFIKAFFIAFKKHQHIGNLGALTLLDPDTEQAIDELQADWIDNKKIVSEYVFVGDKL